MKILYVSQYFPPEMGAPSARVHEMSREWVRAGHDVTVLTGFAHHPTGIKAKADRGRLTRRERIDGIDVLRAYVYATANAGIVKRMVSYASFMVSAAVIGALRARRPDVVVATSPQLLCACAGRALAWRFGVPFVFEVRDLWPESILAVEAMRDNLLVRALKGVAAGLYRSSARIVTVGAGYARQIEARYGIDAAKMDVVPNGIDPDLFSPGPRDNEIRRELGWGDRSVVMYAGTHGMAHALHIVLEAAALLHDDPELLFVFVGEGARKAELEAQARELGLTNVQFLGGQPKARMPSLYAACDLGLVTLRKTPLFQEVLPSKIFEYLAMERPLVISVDGDARELVERAGAGRFVEPEDPRALAEAVQELVRERERLREMGRSGRSYVLANYRRSVLAERYAALLAEVVSTHERARGARAHRTPSP